MVADSALTVALRLVSLKRPYLSKVATWFQHCDNFTTQLDLEGMSSVKL